jgi:hypothetical protein
VATSIAVIYLTYCYYVHGRWLESRSNAVSLEGIRLILLLGAMPFIDFGDMLQGTLMAFAAASLIVLLISAKRKPIDAVI